MSEPLPERIVHTFSSQERYVLINLVEQILELLGQSSVSRDPLHDIVGISGNELPPDDPVLKRLLPSAYHELQDAAEFRRYTEDSLRSRKREHAHRIREMLLDVDGVMDGVMDEDGELDKPDGFVPAHSERSDNSGRSEGSRRDERVFVHGENEVEMSAIRLIISGEDCWAWLGGLNDIRLALAVRLDIGGNSMGDLPNDQHRAGGPYRDADLAPDGLGVADESSTAPSRGDREDERNRRFEVMRESDPMKAVFAVYSWLGWLQEDFLRQLDESESDQPDQPDQPIPHP